MMKRELLNRVKALEARFVPPEPWRITAQFADGHTEIMTASEYRTVKELQPQKVRVIDRAITGNLRELDSWLAMVKFIASQAFNDDEEQDIPKDITELDGWLAKADDRTITAI